VTVGAGHHGGEQPHAVAAAPVLDIGGDVGALLVMTGGDLAGAELELYDADGRPVTHTVVHSRTVDGATVHAGVFPALRQGQYQLGVRPGDPLVAVDIRGGAVTAVAAPPPSVPPAATAG